MHKFPFITPTLKKLEGAARYANHLPPQYAEPFDWLKGWPVFIVGCGPSLDLINNVWERLSDPDLITVGLNRAVLKFTPTFWTLYDSPDIEKIGLKDFAETYDGFSVWSWRHAGNDMKHKRRLNMAPRGGHDAVENWGKQGLGRLYPSGYSASYALETFSSIMKANPTYLVGIDNKRPGDKAYCTDLWSALDVTAKDTIAARMAIEVQRSTLIHHVKAGLVLVHGNFFFDDVFFNIKIIVSQGRPHQLRP